MKTFKQYLTENLFQNRIFHEPTIQQLKNLASGSENKIARFAIDNDNKMHAGDASRWYHEELVSSDKIKYRGYIKDTGKGHVYNAWINNDSKDYKGPETERLEKRGIKHSKWEPF